MSCRFGRARFQDKHCCETQFELSSKEPLQQKRITELSGKWLRLENRSLRLRRKSSSTPPEWCGVRWKWAGWRSWNARDYKRNLDAERVATCKRWKRPGRNAFCFFGPGSSVAASARTERGKDRFERSYGHYLLWSWRSAVGKIRAVIAARSAEGTRHLARANAGHALSPWIRRINSGASYKRIQFLAARKAINFHIFAIATIWRIA